MPLVTCAGCQSRYKLPDGSEGKRLRCPKCQAVIEVPSAPAPAAEAVAPPPAPAPAPSTGQATRIIYLTGKAKGREIPLGGEVILGCDPSCTIVIPDGSLKQAAIKKLPDGWIFRDLGGKGAVPILINDQRLVEKILRDGDKVRIGPLAFQFVQGDDPTAVAPRAAGARAPAAGPTPPMAPAPGVPAPVSSPMPVTTPFVDALVRAASSEEAFDSLLSMVLDAFPRADRALIYGIDARGAVERKPTAMRAADGGTPELPGATVLDKVAATRAPYSTIAGKDQQVFDLLASSATQSQAVLCVPVMHRGRFIGALYLDSKAATDAFAPGDLERLVSLAHVAAVALNEVRLEQTIGRFQQRVDVFSRYMDLSLVERLESAGKAVQTRGEMKKLTVLFTDIRNFTALSEKTEPQKLIAMMNQYFDAMVDAINRYDGYVNKFIGDSIMAFWGAPDARPMDSLQAVRAAMLMQRNLYFLNKDRERDGQAPLFMGVGLHTGNAVVGNVGSAERKEYSALGDTVNTASRIQSLTKLDLPILELNYRIFLSEATYAEVQEQIRAEACPPQEVKGKAQAITVYSIQGVTEHCQEEERAREAVHGYPGDVTVALTDEPESFLARGLSLSRAMLHARLPIALPPGTDVALTLDMGATGKLEDVRARVLEFTPTDEGIDVAFRFDPLPSKKLRRLEDYLAKLEMQKN